MCISFGGDSKDNGNKVKTTKPLSGLHLDINVGGSGYELLLLIQDLQLGY